LLATGDWFLVACLRVSQQLEAGSQQQDRDFCNIFVENSTGILIFLTFAIIDF